MKPSIVTFTGADDETSIDKMVEMSQAYSFVEFGILISSKKQGSPRYPTSGWLTDFVEAKLPKVALHLQGRLLRDLMAGGDAFAKEFADLIAGSQRIQLNFHGEDSILYYDELFKARLAESFPKHQFIFQVDGVNGQAILDTARKTDESERFSPLFDKSAGAGILPDSWPVNDKYPFAGYAGGLGAHNVSKVVPSIEVAASGNRYWIDMETWVCDPKTGLMFDKMYEVLEQVK